MKIKNIAILGVGALGGFIGGALFVTDKLLSSEIMKKALSDTLTQKIDELLFGEDGSKKNVDRQKSTRVSFRDYYNYESKPVQRCHYHNQVIFDNKDNAEAVLDAMDDIIAQYGNVSRADFYELSGIPYAKHDTMCGWNSLNEAQIIRVRDGYAIKLPREQINSLGGKHHE